MSARNLVTLAIRPLERRVRSAAAVAPTQAMRRRPRKGLWALAVGHLLHAAETSQEALAFAALDAHDCPRGHRQGDPPLKSSFTLSAWLAARTWSASPFRTQARRRCAASLTGLLNDTTSSWSCFRARRAYLLISAPPRAPLFQTHGCRACLCVRMFEGCAPCRRSWSAYLVVGLCLLALYPCNVPAVCVSFCRCAQRSWLLMRPLPTSLGLCKQDQICVVRSFCIMSRA